MSDEGDIPRWARELGPETWCRINELLDEGWKTMDIARELSIPEEKRRSLQLYVQKHGPRRRLAQFARFKDAVLGQIDRFGADMVKALSVTAAMAVSNETKPAVQVRAIEVMNNFANMLQRMMAVDQQSEESRQRDEERQGQTIDPAEAVRRVLSQYGVSGDGNA